MYLKEEQEEDSRLGGQGEERNAKSPEEMKLKEHTEGTTEQGSTERANMLNSS